MFKCSIQFCHFLEKVEKSSFYYIFQIYVRSTDVNRTLMSAMANFIGFYDNPSQNERIGIDFPNTTEWPRGFVAVPVHTVSDQTDHVCINSLHFCFNRLILMKLKKSHNKNFLLNFL